MWAATHERIMQQHDQKLTPVHDAASWLLRGGEGRKKFDGEEASHHVSLICACVRSLHENQHPVR